MLFQTRAHGSDEKARDADLPALVARISQVQNGSGIGKADQVLAKQLQAYKADAIPYLLPLLESQEKRIRNFAGYVLSDQKGLTEAHLPALIAAQQRGNGWIPPAIGRIGTPAAIQSLIAALKANPQSHTQTTFAIALAGEPAIPGLVALLDSPVAVSQNLSDAMCQIFSDVNSEASLDLLSKIASDEKVERTNRRFAIKNIGCVHRSARRVIPTLQKLAAADQVNFGAVVDATIMNIGSPESVPYFIKQLRTEPDMVTFRNIAAMHETGSEAGPVLMEFLSNPDPELRVGAARTLGYIAYKPAVELLLPLLQDPDDWRLAYVTAESLGRLHAQQAIPGLEKLASSHWYPPVVKAARFALDVIQGRNAYVSPQNNFPQEFFAFRRIGIMPIDSLHLRIQPVTVRMPDALTAETLATIKYGIETIAWNQGGSRIEHSTTSPTCGLKVADGYLVGRDDGEWGGELAYVAGQSSATILLNENTRGIYRLPFGTLAVTGLAHMGLNNGALFFVVPVEGGGYKAKRWKTLPGGPRFAGVLANGNLFISTVGGDVVVTPEGIIRMATMHDIDGTSEQL
jgi:HEAT repeat protein